jgi:membrane associated rhomboid family serine protease
VADARERVFNVPAVVVALGATLCLIHAVRTFVLSPDQDEAVLELFAFAPLRYSAAVDVRWPGGIAADIWTFVSYAFLHASWLHLGFNLLWFVVFGTPVARRFGARRFLAFFAFTAAAGALAHLISYPGQNVPAIGASAAVIGMLAAALRFVFQPGGPIGRRRLPEDEAYRVPAAPLGAMVRDPRIIVFVLILFILSDFLARELTGNPDLQIAWQAHIGGFVAGLLGFSAFDPVLPVPPGGDDSAAQQQASKDEPSTLP